MYSDSGRRRLMRSYIRFHHHWSLTPAFPPLYEREPLPRKLQDGRELPARIYELDERRKESPEGRRRKTAGQTDEAPIGRDEDELTSNTRAIQNLPHNNRPILSHIRRTRIRSNLDIVRRRLFTFLHTVRFANARRRNGSTLAILLVPYLLVHNQYSALATLRSLTSTLHEPNRRNLDDETVTENSKPEKTSTKTAVWEENLPLPTEKFGKGPMRPLRKGTPRSPDNQALVLC